MPENDIEEDPINGDQLDHVVHPPAAANQNPPQDHFDFLAENIVNNRDAAAEPNVQDNDILDEEPLAGDNQQPPVEQEVLGNQQDNLVQDAQAAGDEGGWNPDALMEDLTWEKVFFK